MAGNTNRELVNVEGVESADDVVAKYLAQVVGDEAEGSGPGQEAAPDTAASGDDFEDVSPIVERVMEQLGSTLDQKLDSVRQDLQDYAERQAQSYSDKTADRLTKRQRQQMQQVESILAPLKDQLGPDYDAAVRQAKLDVVFSGGADDEDVGEAQASQPAAQPDRQASGGQSDQQFAQVYLEKQLGDPSALGTERLNALQRDLSQARDWNEWMATVDRYATEDTQPSQRETQGGSGNAARAQMVGTGASRRAQPTLEHLTDAYNRAAAEGDLAAMEKIGNQIDTILAKR